MGVPTNYVSLVLFDGLKEFFYNQVLSRMGGNGFDFVGVPGQILSFLRRIHV
ncbi:hypothetical protein [Leptospira santarosai]|uniref:Uncharacterized protein n=1 Tax=Leptospira santarosai serovar Arenal str. MAVJ 401 TaxID=1049976 RepID=M6JND3_9LEPT|nr:hypothetical protein [Leptospira santarosai]EMN21128.1 hypothetical protein LEP1GSC063_1158 [Leptospira santarosai serovar Arenal str. MAVJ 401]MDI7235637.1 hypothetical protein [Leptospira santarosai]